MAEKINVGIKSYKINKKFYFNHKHGSGYYFNFTGDDGKDYSVFLNQDAKVWHHYKPISIEGEIIGEKDFYGKKQFTLNFAPKIEYEGDHQTSSEEEFNKILEETKKSHGVKETEKRSDIPDDAIYVAAFNDSTGGEYSWDVTNLELFVTSKGEYWFLNNCYHDTLD